MKSNLKGGEGRNNIVKTLYIESSRQKTFSPKL